MAFASISIDRSAPVTPDSTRTPSEPSAAAASESGADPPRSAPAVPREARPVIERLGLAAVALVRAALFGGVAAASWVGGEPFLAMMGAIGSLMTLWVGH